MEMPPPEEKTTAVRDDDDHDEEESTTHSWTCIKLVPEKCQSWNCNDAAGSVLSVASAPLWCPKIWWGEGGGSKRSRMLRNFLGSAALPRVSTGGRWYASWPPAGPGGQGESGDPALQQQTLEEALFGARLCDLYGSAPSGWAAVILLESKGAETRSGQLRVDTRQKCCRT